MYYVTFNELCKRFEKCRRNILSVVNTINYVIIPKHSAVKSKNILY